MKASITKFIFMCISLALIIIICTSCISTATEIYCQETVKETSNIETIYFEEKYEEFFVINKNTKKFHYTECYYVTIMNDKNKIYFYGSFEKAEEMGYSHCKFCGE